MAITRLKEYITHIPTGSQSITANNTYDISDKAQIVVNVPNPSTGNLPITDLNEHDVSAYATAQVSDSNLVASNIVENINILGIDGSAEVINHVTEVPSTLSSDVIYNSTNNEYYGWCNPLCFTANTAGSTIAMSVNGTPTLGQNFQYSTDSSTWADFTPGTTTVTLTNAGDKVYFKGNNSTGVNESFSIYYNFVMTGSVAASGNIMSLIDDGACETLAIPNAYCFCYLFKDCALLTAPPELPATSLTSDCYGYLFSGCTGLVTPPVLPATTLASSCYDGMFTRCASLITAPELPATTMVFACYGGMFISCTSLTTAPSLPATTLAQYCYDKMFLYCTALTTPPILAATELASDCYTGMFDSCTALEVNDAAVSGVAEHEWRIPATGTFTNTTTYDQTSPFYKCAASGSRASNNMTGSNGESHTYYTQNAPV